MSSERHSYTIKLPECGSRHWYYYPEPYGDEQKELNECLKAGAPWRLAHIQIVGDRSPKKVKEMVRELARFFRREFSYDFAPYDPSWVDPARREFLWYMTGATVQRGGLSDTYIGIGAAGMQKTQFKKRGQCYELGWVWLHPYFRNQGNLTALWPYLRKTFGEFWIQQPLSDAMRSFIIARGYHEVLNRLIPGAIELDRLAKDSLTKTVDNLAPIKDE